MPVDKFVNKDFSLYAMYGDCMEETALRNGESACVLCHRQVKCEDDDDGEHI